ncbi:MAG: ABC transporter substrate-binding protein [Deltaproteobacteria bacterium]|nr:ABC transporter substrate-binding protein [Deltaproteobacteria bacterium]
MAAFKRQYFFGIFIVISVLMITLFASELTRVEAAKPGDVVIATSSAVFNCKGGDPATQTGAPPYVSRTVFDSLISVTTDRKPSPALAKSYKIAAGWKYIDFFLRDDVKFQNGETVTAEDVKYTLGKYLERKYRFVFRPMWRRIIKEVEIVNPTQVRVHLKEADWGFVGRLWWSGGIMPKAYRERVGDKGFSNKPIGAGPFKWVDYKQDQWFKVEAVKNHYRMTPKVKSLKVIYVPEHSTRLAMLKAGEVDIAPLLGAHVGSIKSDPKFKIHWTKFVSGSTIVFADLVAPDTPSPFHDIRVRKAVNLAIDRKIICKKILFGASEPWGDILASITLGYDPSLKPEPYDPERAKALLAEARYPNGFKTTINVQTTSITADALAASLSEIGIRVKVDKYESGAFYERFFTRKFRGLIPYVGWYDVEYNAPSELSDFYLRKAVHTYYRSDEVDTMLRKSMYSETEEELAVWVRKLSKAIRESLITVFLWANHTPYGLGPRIKYWEPTIGSIPSIGFETIELNP